MKNNDKYVTMMYMEKIDLKGTCINLRLDTYLVLRTLASGRNQAKELIAAGEVTLNGKVVKKPSHNVSETDIVRINTAAQSVQYVGRGGIKLAFALEKFDIDVSGLSALDVGASTGGFTDCLLKRGAAVVYALDVGKGQLHPSILADPRVKSFENYNARYAKTEDFDISFDIAVIDLSFISQTLVLPNIIPLLSENSVIISLIKPQFEAGVGNIGKGGIVRKESVRKQAIKKVVDCITEHNFIFSGLVESPITGGDGNIEYLACFTKGDSDRQSE